MICICRWTVTCEIQVFVYLCIVAHVWNVQFDEKIRQLAMNGIEKVWQLKAFSNEMTPKDPYFWIARLHVLAI
jgi:hypothetical protein